MYACSVLDINQSLVDDGLVDKEKIGGSNYYWSFPAKQDKQRQLQHQHNLQEVQRLKVAVEQATAELAEARRGREDEDDVVMEENNDQQPATGPSPKKPKTAGRVDQLQRLADIRAETSALTQELAVLKENDPQALADLTKELRLVTEAANRWTDNIFNCKSYLVKKRGMDRKEACKLLGITAAFDCTCSKMATTGQCGINVLTSNRSLVRSCLYLDPEDKIPKK
jgi:Leucine zipper with capping helix domain/Mnd1 HTH domain